jgi:hypothetical protein
MPVQEHKDRTAGRNGEPRERSGFRWRCDLLDNLDTALLNSGVTQEALPRGPAALRSAAGYCREAAARQDADCASNLMEVATRLETEAERKERWLLNNSRSRARL